MYLLSGVFGYVLLPVAGLLLAGGVAALRPPGPGLRSGIQHFAAGVVFAAVAGELLPDLLKRHATLATIVGFALGVALLLGLEYAARRLQSGAEESPTGLVVVVAIDVLIDGLLLGVGFATGEAAGRLLAVALGLELVSLGLSVGGQLSGAGLPVGQIVARVAAIAVAFAVGAAAGLTVLAGLSDQLLATVLAFGAAALLYLVTEELLVEAHENPGETPLRTAMFFVGFLALLVVEMAG